MMVARGKRNEMSRFLARATTIRIRRWLSEVKSRLLAWATTIRIRCRLSEVKSMKWAAFFWRGQLRSGLDGGYPRSKAWNEPLFGAGHHDPDWWWLPEVKSMKWAAFWRGPPRSGLMMVARGQKHEMSRFLARATTIRIDDGCPRSKAWNEPLFGGPLRSGLDAGCPRSKAWNELLFFGAGNYDPDWWWLPEGKRMKWAAFWLGPLRSGLMMVAWGQEHEISCFLTRATPIRIRWWLPEVKSMKWAAFWLWPLRSGLGDGCPRSKAWNEPLFGAGHYDPE